VNRKSVESLIKSGAFDSLGDRVVLLNNIDALLGFSNKIHKEKELGQTDLFGGANGSVSKPSLHLNKDFPEIAQGELLAWERELLGLYVSQHPLKNYQDYLEEKAVPINKILPQHDGKNVTIGGAISDVREITTKNGKKMAFVKLADEFKEIELIVFPKVYEDTDEYWVRDKVLLVKGKVDSKDRAGNDSDEVKLLVSSAEVIDEIKAKNYKKTGKRAKEPLGNVASTKVSNPAPKVKRIYIRLKSSRDDQTLLDIKKVLDSYSGETEVVLVVGDSKQAIRLPQRVNHEASMSEFKKLLGSMVKLH
jgi:DNA polymerase III subunit alpha